MPELAKQERFNKLLTDSVHQKVWSYSCRLTLTREDAEDLLQDGIIRAYRNLDKLRDPNRFTAWLISIIRNCFFSRKRERDIELTDSYWFEYIYSQQMENQLSEPIAEALAELNPAQREILSLFYLDELSLEETGWVLGVSPQVVGQRLYRARRAMRKTMKALCMSGVNPVRCKQ